LLTILSGIEGLSEVEGQIPNPNVSNFQTHQTARLGFEFWSLLFVWFFAYFGFGIYAGFDVWDFNRYVAVSAVGRPRFVLFFFNICT
jgi:hypothetical protein